ncbi:adventurous gliding motility protein GltG [Myxococcaceae bacterium GXIMD 01537]
MPVPLTLKVFKGETLVSSKDFERDIIKIGRLSSAHLCLEDEKVSRIHSVIELSTDGTLSIIDMGSVEGTYVNGKRVNKGRIAFGDEIRVGGTTIRLENPAAVAALAPASMVAAPAVSGAIDDSFAATQNHQVVPAEDSAPGAEPAPRVRIVRKAKKSSGPMGVSIRFMWGDQRVGEFFLAPGEKHAFGVGSAKGVQFVMGDSKLGSERLDMVRSDGQSFSVAFTGKMTGELTRQGDTRDLKAVIESGKASHEGDAYVLALEADDFLWADLGGVTMEVHFAPVPKKVLIPLSESIDFVPINIFLGIFLLGSLFVIDAMNRGADGDELADDLNGDQARIAKFIVKPPDAQKNKLIENLQAQKEKAREKKSGEMTAKYKGEKGQMGKKDAPKTANRTALKGDPSKKDQARSLTARIFGGGKGGIGTTFGSGGLGGELKSAMGNMFGAKAGDSGGFGGLGLRGSGKGGGTGETLGIGGVGTKGRTSGYGAGVGVLGGKEIVDITSSGPIVMGSLDKELIRQVIQRNRGQIRYCYESQLNRVPKLNGKVAIKFVIKADGSVASSEVAQSTAGDAELEQCVAGRVRTWQFPKPKGDGVVVVTYPFIFKQSGE